MKSTIIVYGPAGCGKTTNAMKIAKAYGLFAIIDDWAPEQEIPPHATLVLTREPPMRWPNSAKLVHFHDAMTYVRRFSP